MSSTPPPLRTLSADAHRIVLDLGLMALIGLFFALVPPFDTSNEALPLRLVYWIGVMVAGGGLLTLIERVLFRVLPGLALWQNVLATAAAITVPQTGIVIAAEVFVFENPVSVLVVTRLLPAVFIISVAALSVMRMTRTLASRPAEAPASDPHPVAAEADLLAQRLPAPLRHADILALQAEDHYVHIHTSAGSHMVLMRFADAIALAEANRPGHRLHRSWWAAADAIAAIRYARGSGQAELKGGLSAPVSRTYYPALKDAGWV